MKKELVLIEGIPGSGKSTCARFLANQFERNGYKCSLFLETTYEHKFLDLLFKLSDAREVVGHSIVLIVTP